VATRVLHFIGQIGVGGCEKQLLELCRRMDRSRFEFGVCYYSPDPENMVEEFKETGAQLYYVNKFGGISLWRFFLTLRQFIKDFRPDIIHTWQYSPNWWGRTAGLTCGYRRFIASERTARLSYGRMLSLAERWLGPHTVWVANSGAVAQRLAHTLPLREEAIRVIPNAVEPSREDRPACRASVRREFGFAPDQPLVVSVGRLVDVKNYPMLFRAAKSVLAQRPDVRFLVAGHGPMESDLARLRDEMALGDSLRLLGLRNDVPRLLAAADVFCSSSRVEGCPNAILEAMTSGLPVVAARFAGADEVINDGKTGFLTPLDDDQALVTGLLDLLNDPARRTATGQAAQDSMQDRFSYERLVRDMERLYSDFPNAGPPQIA